MNDGELARVTRTDAAPCDHGRDLTPVLRTLARVARVISQVTNLEQLVEVAAEEVRLGLDASTVSVSQLVPGTGTLRTLINVGDLGPTGQRWPDNEVSSLQSFLQSRGIVSHPDPQTWAVTVNDADTSELTVLRELGKGAAMAAPLIVNNSLWGELYITYAGANRAFGSEDRAFVEVYRAILESGLTKVRQILTLERLASTDPMTGLANRRALDEAATTAFALLAGRDTLRINVVAIDLNGLKQVNDYAGHAEGDRLITSAAAIIQNHFNRLPGSLAARSGGDEFVVLVPSHSTELVAAAARTACSAIAALPLGDGASCGIAIADSTHADSSVQQLFRRADAAQYRSKRFGGLVIDDPGRLPAPTKMHRTGSRSKREAAQAVLPRHPTRI